MATMTTSTTNTTLPDNRAMDRGETAVQPANGGTKEVKKKAKDSGTVTWNVDVKGAQVTSALGSIVTEARTASTVIAGLIPASLAGKVKVTGKGLDRLPYISGMAGIQIKFGDQLGPLPTNAQNMQDLVAVVGVVQEAVPALTGLVTSLMNLGNACLVMAFGEAGIIYGQARVLAKHNQELADALKPFVDALAKPAKKGAKAKKEKAKAADKVQPAPAAPAAPTTTTSTTVTSA
jgi:hypothetical protein